MHPLDGPRAKIVRAKSQLVALQTTFQRFLKQYRYNVVIAEFDRKTECYNLRVQSGPPAFPNEWGVLIGEIAHNLRSALDGLIWQLALLEKSEPYRLTAFPIKLGGKKDPFWVKGAPLHLLKSIDRRFWESIEAFQPYKRGNGGRRNPLFLLKKLNDTDKHRLITVLSTTVAGMSLTGVSGGSRLKIGVPLYMNAKVGQIRSLPAGGVRVFDITRGKARMQYEVQVNIDVTPEIRFGNRCNAVKGLPVIRTLTGIMNKVSSVIESESFTREF